MGWKIGRTKPILDTDDTEHWLGLARNWLGEERIRLEGLDRNRLFLLLRMHIHILSISSFLYGYFLDISVFYFTFLCYFMWKEWMEKYKKRMIKKQFYGKYLTFIYREKSISGNIRHLRQLFRPEYTFVP